MTILPVAASPISAATSAKLADGRARTITSAVVAAAAFEVAIVAPLALGDAAGIFRIARRDGDGVAGGDERRGEGAADVAGSDDGDIHWGCDPFRSA